MDTVSRKLTVFFGESFWMGAFERVPDGKLSVCKVTFGSEPKDYEIYGFVLKKSQHALKLQQEPLKIERNTVIRELRETEKQRQFELKQQKRKEKHRSR